MSQFELSVDDTVRNGFIYALREIADWGTCAAITGLFVKPLGVTKKSLFAIREGILAPNWGCTTMTTRVTLHLLFYMASYRLEEGSPLAPSEFV